MLRQEPEADSSPTEIKETNLDRPPLVTLICALGMIGAMATVYVLFSAGPDDGINRLYLAFTALVGFTSLVGFWYMKRWGLYLYFAMLLLNQAMMVLVFKNWTPASLMAPVLVVLVGIRYYDRMT
jgi:hypothetical protein